MEGFQFHDIFATKGVEYLLVIGYLVLLIVFIKALMKDGAEGKQR